MKPEDRKALARGRREALKRQGLLTAHRAVKFTDRKKRASRDACRGKVRDDG